MYYIYIVLFILLISIIICKKRKFNIIECLVFFTSIIVASIFLYFQFDDYQIVHVDKEIFDIKITNNSDMNINIDNLDNNINLYNKFSKYKINEINFSTLKDINSSIVNWIMVDGTNINYPVVQSIDNDYYLHHDLLKRYSNEGWVFLDYRNDYKMNDMNTIFYGHNLLNGTAFGSLENIFSDNWFNNSSHYIVILVNSKKYIYEVFSCYYSDKDTYYLQNNFVNDSEYEEFLFNIKNKSKYNFNISLDNTDKIITLSTCTDDNKGRKVVHAKLINKK